MKALIQRVNRAQVTVSGKEIAKIGKGYLILFGVKDGDSGEEVKLLAEKTVNLRVMSDANDKMNLSILDSGGSVLVVSQFTLYADLSGGRRPSFIRAARPDTAQDLYETYVSSLKKLGVKDVQTGLFGTYMSVEIVNDGPVTIMLDTDELSHKLQPT